MLTIKNIHKIKNKYLDNGSWYVWDIYEIEETGMQDNTLYHYYSISLTNPNDNRTQTIFLNRIPDENNHYELSALIGAKVYKEILHIKSIMHIPTLLIYIRILMIDGLSNKKRV